MTFLADDNFPRPAVQALREAGFDVLWIAQINPGAADDEVLALCVSTSRTILTFDKDFGELAFRRRLKSPCGIVPFPDHPAKSRRSCLARSFGDSVATILGSAFSVVTRQRIRMRPLLT
jgi:predicted nuclease of predicted toxin-antitoxin system